MNNEQEFRQRKDGEGRDVPDKRVVCAEAQQRTIASGGTGEAACVCE